MKPTEKVVWWSEKEGGGLPNSHYFWWVKCLLEESSLDNPNYPPTLIPSWYPIFRGEGLRAVSNTRLPLAYLVHEKVRPCTYLVVPNTFLHSVPNWLTRKSVPVPVPNLVPHSVLNWFTKQPVPVSVPNSVLNGSFFSSERAAVSRGSTSSYIRTRSGSRSRCKGHIDLELAFASLICCLLLLQ